MTPADEVDLLLRAGLRPFSGGEDLWEAPNGVLARDEALSVAQGVLSAKAWGPVVAGESAADRLMRQQYVQRAVRDLGLTAEQAAAVLRGLADHTALMAALDYRRDVTSPWPEATSLGMWLHAVADRLEGGL